MQFKGASRLNRPLRERNFAFASLADFLKMVPSRLLVMTPETGTLGAFIYVLKPALGMPCAFMCRMHTHTHTTAAHLREKWSHVASRASSDASSRCSSHRRTRNVSWRIFIERMSPQAGSFPDDVLTRQIFGCIANALTRRILNVMPNLNATRRQTLIDAIICKWSNA